MNYIEADKLIAEIEMRIAQWQTYTFACASQIASEAFDRIDELKGLLIYITSLQQEQPSLPSNLDEAAKEYCSDNTTLGATCRACFRDGAEWLAGQGVTMEAVIGMATEEISINVSQETLNELDLCPGDKVVVQIRKKQ